MTSSLTSIHRSIRPVFFAGFFTDFLAALLAGVFLAAAFSATFLAAAFLAAFFVTAFFTASFTAFLAGAFFRTLVTEVTADLMAPATSEAIAIPTPIVSPAFSTIVFSAILIPHSFCALAPLRIVEVYQGERKSLLLSPQIIGFSLLGP